MWIQELVDWGPSSSDFALLRALERDGCLMRKTVTSLTLTVITFETLFFPFKSILSPILLSNVGGRKYFLIQCWFGKWYTLDKAMMKIVQLCMMYYWALKSNVHCDPSYNVKSWTTKRYLDVFRVVQLATTTWNWLRTTPNSEANQWWNLKEMNLKTAMCHNLKGDFTSIPAESQATESLWATAK